MELCHWWGGGDMNIIMKKFIDSVTVKSAELKDQFLV